MKKAVSGDAGQVKIRLPGRLRHHLEHAMKKSGRTLTKEIEWRLEQSFKAEYASEAKEVADLKAWVLEQIEKSKEGKP